MNPIIQFLKEQDWKFSDSSEINSVEEKDIENLKGLLENHSKTKGQPKDLKLKPSIQRNQIWIVKSEYDDFLSISQNISHPFLVLINGEPQDLGGEAFVRVLVISPFIEMATTDDEICNDSSIIGFPFLIESCNDQPILAELLDEYLGYYEPTSFSLFETKSYNLISEAVSAHSKIETKSTSRLQQEFRDIEISRAKYINHSVLSLLSFLENKQSQDAGVVISIFDKIEYPKFYIGQIQKEQSFALAARSGIGGEDKYLLLDNESIPLKIYFRKNEDGFVISVNSTEKIQLFSDSKNEIKSESNQEKIVFANLKAGNYTLLTKSVEQPIKIRLK